MRPEDLPADFGTIDNERDPSDVRALGLRHAVSARDHLEHAVCLRDQRIKDLEDVLDLRDAATKALCIAIHGEARPEASIYSLTLDADAQRKRIASLERALKVIASGMLGDKVLSELELSGIASAALDAEKAFWHGEGR